ncbi:DNA gyrase inhibitor YacG [Sphingomonas aracearum]|uniref:DNA gyrase inhibitor YacG n=1 Tax=Sphingomonas aracearum TaxID=2283317 RepID=A0A369VUZ2_9SPHN|nr:DNA gyrase inhibitor YacG [Sphingomonas aracearum]RDE04892.1 DNA gyrase inhibitor YacG [Sphingomonas aracearum]
MPASDCPLCGKPAAPAHRPFCSQGCRDRDLLQWLGGGYALPGPPVDPDDINGLDRPDRSD